MAQGNPKIFSAHAIDFDFKTPFENKLQLYHYSATTKIKRENFAVSAIFLGDKISCLRKYTHIIFTTTRRSSQHSKHLIIELQHGNSQELNSLRNILRLSDRQNGWLHLWGLPITSLKYAIELKLQLEKY